MVLHENLSTNSLPEDPARLEDIERHFDTPRIRRELAKQAHIPQMGEWYVRASPIDDNALAYEND